MNDVNDALRDVMRWVAQYGQSPGTLRISRSTRIRLLYGEAKERARLRARYRTVERRKQRGIRRGIQRGIRDRSKA